MWIIRLHRIHAKVFNYATNWDLNLFITIEIFLYMAYLQNKCKKIDPKRNRNANTYAHMQWNDRAMAHDVLFEMPT